MLLHLGGLPSTMFSLFFCSWSEKPPPWTLYNWRIEGINSRLKKLEDLMNFTQQQHYVPWGYLSPHTQAYARTHTPTYTQLHTHTQTHVASPLLPFKNDLHQSQSGLVVCGFTFFVALFVSGDYAKCRRVGRHVMFQAAVASARGSSGSLLRLRVVE